jgi:FAD/FMN-containing dehydrogenase
VRRPAKLLRKLGPVSVLTAFGDVECEKLWGLRRAYSDSLKATGLTKLNEDVVVPRGKLVELAEFGERLAKQHGYRSRASATRATATSTSTSWPRATTTTAA